MFWFISPWEAARRSLEAQRHLCLGFSWLPVDAIRGYPMWNKPPLRRHRDLRGLWLLQVQQQSPPAELSKLSSHLLALVGRARGLKERTRAVRNELLLAFSSRPGTYVRA
jgi:hypothetical protein